MPTFSIVEVYGPESSGKTTLALQILAEAQKMGGEVAFIDVEHALDPTYAAALGVDIDSLLFWVRYLFLLPCCGSPFICKYAYDLRLYLLYTIYE